MLQRMRQQRSMRPQGPMFRPGGGGGHFSHGPH
jgi:hypothetical protein